MTRVRRIAEEKRLLVLPVVVALAANALVYAAAVMPLTGAVSRAGVRAEAATVALREARERHAVAQSTVESKIRADEDLKKFYGEVLPRDWSAARRLVYTRLEQLARDSNLRPSRTGGEPDRNEDSALARLTVTMVVAGEYQGMREFIYALESSPGFVIVDNVALAQGEETNAPLVLTIEVSTYYWAKDHGV